MTIQVATQLKKARTEQLLTQFDVAVKANLSLPTIQRAESGQPVHPRTARRIFLALNIPITAAA